MGSNASSGYCCCQCIQSGEAGVVETCGNFKGVAFAGVQCICCPCQYIPGIVSLRVQQLNVDCETKTKDNVTVRVVVAIQYQAQKNKIEDAYYALDNPEAQINSYVEDTVRSTIPLLTLDEAFAAKDRVALSVKERLTVDMEYYGWSIVKTLVTDVLPDGRVLAAMNEINAAVRQKDAALEKAEAEKLMVVKAAEADAEARYLSGKGVARQRKAIVDGLRDSVLEFSNNIPGTRPQDVMNLLLTTQYFDALKDIGSGNSQSGTTVFIPHSPAAVADINSQIRDSIIHGRR